MKIHVDTDIGGDPDDACALAMLLGWPEVEILGVTTVLDPGGRRAGMAAELLRRAGRDDIPVAAGAEATLTTLARPAPQSDDVLYWGHPIAPCPAPPGAALDLLERSIAGGATVAAIGSFTNLAILEACGPGTLADARVVAMGGWVRPPEEGLPDWGPEMDWNVQCDVRAAQVLAQAARLTLVTLPATLKAHLRAADLPRLRASGPLGELLARQAEAYGPGAGMPELGRAHPALPADLLNFHYDPVCCAVAAGWPGAAVERMRLDPVREGELLRFLPSDQGREIEVVLDVDGEAFGEAWFAAVEAAQRQA
jgi:inosine-uridine nucleoside N-ribohydrolase